MHLRLVLSHCPTRSDRAAVRTPNFRCHVLKAILDAVYHAASDAADFGVLVDAGPATRGRARQPDDRVRPRGRGAVPAAR
jgi:hypothetical protein